MRVYRCRVYMKSRRNNRKYRFIFQAYFNDMPSKECIVDMIKNEFGIDREVDTDRKFMRDTPSEEGYGRSDKYRWKIDEIVIRDISKCMNE